MSWLGPVAYHASRLVLAGVFIYAGFVKSSDPVAFAGQVANYKILPYAWNFLVAATLPYLEIACGFLLLINKRVRPALLVLIPMNLLFMLILISAISRGLDIDCGCFNPNAENATTPVAALLRDIGLMVLMIIAWVIRCKQEPPAEQDS